MRRMVMVAGLFMAVSAFAQWGGNPGGFGGQMLYVEMGEKRFDLRGHRLH